MLLPNKDGLREEKAIHYLSPGGLYAMKQIETHEKQIESCSSFRKIQRLKYKCIRFLMQCSLIRNELGAVVPAGKAEYNYLRLITRIALKRGW